jgi:palmitoyl-protein thioesterase
VQRCNSPPVKNLITLGSQHQGVSTLPGCKESSMRAQSSFNPTSWFDRTPLGAFLLLIRELIREDPDCSWWKQLLKMGVYSPLVRSQVVQAQYFKDVTEMRDYLRHNRFLLDINNDGPQKNSLYAERLASLRGFYMYIFEEDSVVVPKESGWFGIYNPERGQIDFLANQPLYLEDWLGLRVLAGRNALYFRKLPGEHLRLSREFFQGELADILRS